jgi:hypothetical protein
MSELKLLCPKCEGKQNCPCESCQKRNKAKVTWIWKSGNGPIACGHCGYTMSPGEWEMEEFKQYDKWREKNEKPRQRL